MSENIRTLKIGKVDIRYPETMSEEEALEYYQDQITIVKKPNLLSIDISLIPKEDNPDELEVELAPHYDSVIRVRRITGYLSTIPRFNDAKKDEAKQRVSHVEINIQRLTSITSSSEDEALSCTVDQKYITYARKMYQEERLVDNFRIADRLLADGFSKRKVYDVISRLTPNVESLLPIKEHIDKSPVQAKNRGR